MCTCSGLSWVVACSYLSSPVLGSAFSARALASLLDHNRGSFPRPGAPCRTIPVALAFMRIVSGRLQTLRSSGERRSPLRPWHLKKQIILSILAVLLSRIISRTSDGIHRLLVPGYALTLVSLQPSEGMILTRRTSVQAPTRPVGKEQQLYVLLSPPHNPEP